MQSHFVGRLLTLIHDAWTHEHKKIVSFNPFPKHRLFTITAQGVKKKQIRILQRLSDDLPFNRQYLCPVHSTVQSPIADRELAVYNNLFTLFYYKENGPKLGARSNKVEPAGHAGSKQLRRYYGLYQWLQIQLKIVLLMMGV